MWKHCPFATDCPRSVLWRLLEHGGGQSRPFHRDTHIMKHKIDPTRYNWKPVVASFLLHMRERGFECIIVNNGGDNESVTNMDQAIDHACATDEAVLFFKTERFQHTRPLGAALVFCCQPHELVADMNTSDRPECRAFEAAVDEWSESMGGMECPCEGMTAWHYLRMAQACLVASGAKVPPHLAADVLAGM